MTDKLLLCTDLDRTLIPNGAQPESQNARKLFCQFVSNENITLVYVTGRDKDLVQKAMYYYELPIPDFVIADVGSSIYSLHVTDKYGIQWELNPDWQACFVKDWQGYSHSDIEKLFSELPGLKKQEASKQKPFKLSYYVPVHHDHHKLINAMIDRLKIKGIDAELIWSIDEPNAIGLLDVMPKHATKRNAIEFLMHEQQFNLGNTLFAGDSGNDLDVLLSPIKSILVANAHSEVKKTAKAETTKDPDHNNIYLASGAFMNGNYSAGILEGIQHYKPELIQDLGITDE